MSIEVLKPGLLTTLQDAGRYGHQRHGVPVSGAMDPFALRVANLLVGNPAEEAALEITLQGPVLRFEKETVVAVCGASLSPRLNGEPVAEWQSLRVLAGSVLEFGRAEAGCRAYLAVAGGLDVPLVMGSKSTYLRGKLGGFAGRALKAGDVLPVGESARRLVSVECPFVSWKVFPGYAEEPMVRVVRGHQFEAFSEESQERFLQEAFRVTPQSDRMGYRLQGEALSLREPLEMISEAVTAGTVQVPPDGQPIVLMADCQTTGGYPKIAQVATVDLPVMAQLKPGDRVRFQEITLEEAHRLYRQRERDMQILQMGLELGRGSSRVQH